MNGLLPQPANPSNAHCLRSECRLAKEVVRENVTSLKRRTSDGGGEVSLDHSHLNRGNWQSSILNSSQRRLAWHAPLS